MFLVIVSEGLLSEGWDIEEIEICDEDLMVSGVKIFMDEVKVGNLEEF